ncbi:DUF4179 domain-containing protein [Alkalihalobacterium elongatum]|uniref:DUF4179 domain-containing protein n=1 Tax=Alkalihalobacterium elongatum TaxID=2675466 RepID=UPI001C1FE26B|nr:DUF4179 domain-containing protein [Alkalihalobacterium elongatum]
MEKWEQQLKNDVNTSLPTELEQRISKTLQQLPRKKRRSKFIYGLSAAALALIVTTSLPFISPTIAETMKNLPVVGSAFEFVGNIGMKKGADDGLATSLGEQIEFDGHLVTFTETLYDGGEIHLGYIIEMIDPTQPPNFLGNFFELFINGKPAGSYGMGGNEEEVKEGMYIGAISIRLREDVPDSFLLGLRPNESRSWFVQLPVEKQGDQKSFLVNQKRETNELAIVYDKVTFFPTSTELTLRLIMDEEAFFNDHFMLLDYLVTDDQGRVLQPFSGGGGGNGPENGKVTHTFEQYFEPLDTVPSSITIRPYLGDFKDTAPNIIRKKWINDELTLSQGEMGEITFLDVIKSDDVFTLSYEVSGIDAYRQANAFWLEDGDGNRYHSLKPALRVDGTNHQYQSSFETTLPIEELYITTIKMNAPNFLEELEIIIDLDR